MFWWGLILTGKVNLTLAHSGSRSKVALPKAPEGWRSPRRFARLVNHRQTLCVMDCGDPPPLFPATFQTVPMLTEIAIFDPPVFEIVGVVKSRIWRPLLY